MSAIESEICSLQYNEEERTPRILTSCGHTICQQCAIALLSANPWITCPFDRKQTRLIGSEGVNGLQKNFALLNLWRKEKQEQEGHSGEKADVPCFENPSHEAIFYCQQCEVELCDSCFTSVHKSKTHSTHQKVNISEKPIKLPKCPKHPHNIAEFLCTDPYCANSTKIMCQTCVLFDQHKSHKHGFLMEKLLENEQILKNGLKDLKVFQESAEVLVETANQNLGSYQVTGEAFQKAAQSISDQFDIMKMEALCKLTQFANEKEEEQAELKKKIDERCRAVREIKELIEEKLKIKNDLQNTDKIFDSWKKMVGSENLSTSDFHNLNDYEFIVSDVKLQIKPKSKVPEPCNLEKFVTDRDKIPTRDEQVIRNLQKKVTQLLQKN